MPVSLPLQRFVEEELAAAPLLIEEARLAAIEQLLHPGAGSGLAASDGALRLDASQALRTHGAPFCQQYVQALSTLVRDALAAFDGVPAARGGNGCDAGLHGLSLMDEARVESDMEISRAAMLIDSAVEWEHRELQTFTSALRGEAHVGSDSNPINPAQVARALWQATDALATPPAPRVLALRAVAAAIGAPLKRAYAAACSRIEALGVEPSAYRTVLFTPGSVADVGATVTAGRPAGLPGATGGLSGLLARMTIGAVAPASGTPPDATLEALARLDRLTRHAGGGLRDAAAQTGAAAGTPAAAAATRQSGAQTAGPRAAAEADAPPGVDPRRIELLSRLFDALLADPTLPPPARGVIARLQASVLRIGLREAALLDAVDHPVWRMLDRIADACQQTAAAGPARLAALASTCDGQAEEIARQATPDAALYRQALVRLEALLADELRRAQHGAQGAITALQRTERRMRMQAQVQARLEEQFVRCPVGPATRRFLLGASAQALAEAILHSGPDGEPTAALTRTVDDLLWSLHPPAHPASRQRLVKMLPGLLGRLRAHMAHCGLAAGEQQALLDELEASHTASLWPRGGSGAPAAETPEEIVRRLRDEIVEDAPPRRDFGDSVLDLSTLDTVPAELMPDLPAPAPLPPAADRPRPPPAGIATLAPGRAARLLLQGHWIDAQLLWRNDGGDLLLFADTDGRTHALTRRAIERLEAEGLVRIAPPGSLVQRAIDRLLAAADG